MDFELLVALYVLWFSSTFAMVTFLRMWLMNGGEAFHPHSVDVEHRHTHFLVVNSTTFCKLDCPVKSISTFVAPRGSSASKQFTVLIVMIAIAGFLGTSRWYSVKDASALEASLSYFGFASLLLVTAFELDVGPERFLEDKLIVTGWLIAKLKLSKRLPFSLQPDDEGFRDFLRQSKDIYHLYEEDRYILNRAKRFHMFQYKSLWPSLHVLGACAYIVFVTSAIIINDYNESKVAWITGGLFGWFCFLAYLTGNYFPVLKYLRGWILLWNPFLREPHFMYKLKKAAEEYLQETSKSTALQRKGSEETAKLRHRSISGREGGNHRHPINLEEATEADKALDSIFLRYARTHPQEYLTIIGHMLVMSEMIAMMTPCVAMGIQWVTALCDGPPLLSIIDLFLLLWSCFATGSCQLSNSSNCILKHD